MMTPMLESLIQEQPRVVYVEDEKSTTQLLATEEGRRLEYEARSSEDAGQPTRYSRRTLVRTARNDSDNDNNKVAYFSYPSNNRISSNSQYRSEPNGTPQETFISGVTIY